MKSPKGLDLALKAIKLKNKNDFYKLFKFTDPNKLFKALKADFTQRGEQISDMEIAKQAFRIAKLLITTEQLQKGKRLLQQNADAFTKANNKRLGRNSPGFKKTIDDEVTLSILVEPDDFSPQFAHIRRQVFSEPV